MQAVETRQELQATAGSPHFGRIAVLWRVLSPEQVVSTRFGKTILGPARGFGRWRPLPGGQVGRLCDRFSPGATCREPVTPDERPTATCERFCCKTPFWGSAENSHGLRLLANAGSRGGSNFRRPPAAAAPIFACEPASRHLSIRRAFAGGIVAARNIESFNGIEPLLTVTGGRATRPRRVAAMVGQLAHRGFPDRCAGAKYVADSEPPSLTSEPSNRAATYGWPRWVRSWHCKPGRQDGPPSARSDRLAGVNWVGASTGSAGESNCRGPQASAVPERDFARSPALPASTRGPGAGPGLCAQIEHLRLGPRRQCRLAAHQLFDGTPSQGSGMPASCGMGNNVTPACVG
jgi:hypothetical protein